MNRKMIWIGDAVISSGFSRCTHEILKTLCTSWDVYVLGLNYHGDPHELLYPVYPCSPGGDGFGLGRMVEIITKVQPDIIVVQNDPWNIPAYLTRAGNVPVIASMPVDGKNCRGRGLNGLAMGIFWTEFGLYEARLGGFSGPSAIVPLGVDTNIYRPHDRIEARKRLRLSEKLKDAFIVGNVNRNQPRKRLDLTISYFAEWIKSHEIRDAYLFLHVAPTGDMGFDVSQLMEYYGLASKLIIATPEIGFGIKENDLAATYATFDVQLSTSQGEGWGLTTMEGMACGIPQIAPDWAALGEWAKDAVYLIPCTATSATPSNINVIGGIADEEKAIQALNEMYSDTAMRKEYSERGRALVNKEEYRWESVGRAFQEAIESALYPRIIKKEEERVDWQVQ